jgi:hypothetical protein
MHTMMRAGEIIKDKKLLGLVRKEAANTREQASQQDGPHLAQADGKGRAARPAGGPAECRQRHRKQLRGQDGRISPKQMAGPS